MRTSAGGCYTADTASIVRDVDCARVSASTFCAGESRYEREMSKSIACQHQYHSHQQNGGEGDSESAAEAGPMLRDESYGPGKGGSSQAAEREDRARSAGAVLTEA